MPDITILQPATVHPTPPYLSHGSAAGRLVFVGGQVPLDRSGNVVGVGDIRAQTRQALANLAVVLDAAGATFRHVTNVTVYLRTMADYDAFNEVYQQFADGWYPPRATIACELVHPDFLIELQAVAVRD